MKKVWIVLLTLLMCSCKPQLQLKEKYKNVSWSYSPDEDIVYVAMVQKEEIKKEWNIPLTDFNAIYVQRYSWDLSNYFYVYSNDTYKLVAYVWDFKV